MSPSWGLAEHHAPNNDEKPAGEAHERSTQPVSRLAPREALAMSLLIRLASHITASEEGDDTASGMVVNPAALAGAAVAR